MARFPAKRNGGGGAPAREDCCCYGVDPAADDCRVVLHLWRLSYALAVLVGPCSRGVFPAGIVLAELR